MRANYLLAIILAVVLFGLGGIISPPAQAATFTVNATADAVDLIPGDGQCQTVTPGQCTLRAAIMETNALPGTDTIMLPAGTYVLSLTGTGEDNAVSGDLDIQSNLLDIQSKLTIQGAGAATTIIDGNGSSSDPDRVFQVIGPVRVELVGVTVTNGYVGSGPGGGIYNNGGELYLTNCAVTFNTAFEGDGAGIFNDVDGALIAVGTTFEANGAGGNGGAVYNAGFFQSEANIYSANSGLNGGGIYSVVTGLIPSYLTINQDTFVGNSTYGTGGGGLFNNGTLLAENSAFYNNFSVVVEGEGGLGGALYNDGVLGSVARLTNVTIGENSVFDNILSDPAGNGGGIYNRNPNLEGLLLVNVTLNRNSAAQGGGLYNDADADGQASLLNTILANNTGGNCSGSITSLGNNLDSGTTCGFGVGDISGQNPLLLDLLANGGPTLTYALDKGSPAIDAGNSYFPPYTDSVTTDQRLYPRVGTFDIGAYEFGADGAFGKTAPVNGATGQSLTPQLSWEASTGATGYEYCYDTTNDSACDGAWTPTTGTSATLAGLSASTTYFWQVRAINVYGTTNADGGTWWSFTTIVPPAAFAKTAPTNGATGQSLTPQLSWAASTGATSYETCYDTTNDSACAGGAWTPTTGTSASLAGLSAGTTYYWQVRAINSDGTTNANGGTWWSFTTIVPPAAFGKTAPTNGATGQSLTPQLTWAASTGATGYETCYDTTNDSACTGAWTPATGTSVTLAGLTSNNTYYWQVRAINGGGTTLADSNTWWSFTTLAIPPTAFGKTAPVNGATGQSLTPVLTWVASTEAASYEYCYDTTNDSACTGTWTPTTGTSVTLAGLTSNTTYYWQVRAINTNGTTNADNGDWWSFTTLAISPAAFGKTAPVNAATGQSLTPVLTWVAGTGAASYEYCVDTTNDDTCAGAWTGTTGTSVTLADLTSNTTYYWQVRAINTDGTTNADGGAWWSFTTGSHLYLYLPAILK